MQLMWDDCQIEILDGALSLVVFEALVNIKLIIKLRLLNLVKMVI